MAILSVQFPEDVFAMLRLSPDETAQELRVIAAMYWYCAGTVSQEKSAQIAGMDRPDFIRALAKYGLPAFHVSIDEVRREAALW